MRLMKSLSNRLTSIVSPRSAGKKSHEIVEEDIEANVFYRRDSFDEFIVEARAQSSVRDQLVKMMTMKSETQARVF
ncbi:hypothetical protein NDN08_003228 [Rhodosorus marinus]|uniref:Uncharacterized protein n=1 Tax=Rhodosorus marinus TaxID=101924 RepID=A0AAV8UW12_9RHOD|nr:hypothetical protein NDN08_003228 [Rhodosorus marinus]